MFNARLSLISSALGLMLAAASVGAQASDNDSDDQKARGNSLDRCASGVPDTRAASVAQGGTSAEKLAKRSSTESLNLVALSDDNQLLCLNEDAPQRARLIGTVNGLSVDTTLVGIDFRVQDGLLYGVGNAGGVYTINTANAVATLVNRLGTPLVGSRFGVDFNPAADRLRIVSDAGQNLRHNVNAGGLTLVDSSLNNGAAPASAPVANVVSAAYTNNDLTTATLTLGADTATTLLVINAAANAAADAVQLQSPPNAGVVANTGRLTLAAEGRVGFDIYSKVRSGVTLGNRALASFKVAGASGLYHVDLLTGRATLAGRFATGLSVADIAVPLNQD